MDLDTAVAFVEDREDDRMSDMIDATQEEESPPETVEEEYPPETVEPDSQLTTTNIEYQAWELLNRC